MIVGEGRGIGAKLAATLSSRGERVHLVAGATEAIDLIKMRPDAHGKASCICKVLTRIHRKRMTRDA